MLKVTMPVALPRPPSPGGRAREGSLRFKKGWLRPNYYFKNVNLWTGCGARQAICNNIDIHINSSNTTTINKELFSKYLINLENLGGRTKAPPFSSMLYLFIIYFIYFIPRYLVFVWRAAEPEPPPSEGGWRSPAAGACAPILTGLKISHLFTKSVRANTIILI